MPTKRPPPVPPIEEFDLQVGRVLARKYEVLQRLGKGWEGEVYKVREIPTGIERAVKLFFPARNPRDRTVRFYARKLHRLRHCPILIQYHTQDRIVFRNQPITFLVSDYVEGTILSEFVSKQPGGRLAPFEALHLLHALASGVEAIHAVGEYHGDLHTENVIVRRYGLGFELKLLDMFHWGAARSAHIRDDVLELVRIFYEISGGRARYSRQPRQVKEICCGLKRTLILRKFRTAGQLRDYLESMAWA